MTEEPHVCYKCVGDPFLKSEIKTHGEYIKCTYCARKLNGYSLNRLANRCENALLTHYERTPSEMDEWEYAMHSADKESTSPWYREGYPLIDLLQEDAQISEKLAREILEILEEKYNDFEDDLMGIEAEFDSEALYDMKAQGDGVWQEGWNNFEQILKSQSRYFNQEINTFLNKVFDGLDKLKSGTGSPIIVAAGPGAKITNLSRARVFQSEERLKEALKNPSTSLGPPPSIFAKAGRMNATGISVFYGASDPHTAIAEVRPPVGSSVVVAGFDIVRPLQLLDLTSFEELHTWFAGSIFDPNYSVNLKRNVFLRNISSRIIMPVMPEQEVFEYLPTQVIADFLSAKTDLQIDGIIYKSVQVSDDSVNVVLFHKASKVADMKFPKIGKILSSVGIYDEEYDSIPITMEILSKTKKTVKLSDSILLEQTSDSREDTLKIDIKQLAVHVLNAVSYTSQSRPVVMKKFSKIKKADF